jgi:leucyl-tRNA synthetase
MWRSFRLFSSKADLVSIEKKWNSVVTTALASPLHDGASSAAGERGIKYILPMFAYPSGSYLHAGHVRCYGIADAIARLHVSWEAGEPDGGRRLFYPRGFDAFGLPAEAAAEQHGIDPAAWTKDNIASFVTQMQRIGLGYTNAAEPIEPYVTADPTYYRATQELFCVMFEQGLAYRKESWVQWDPVDETVLANEQVDAEGRGWRSGALVEHRLMHQWFFATSRYAQELLDGLDAEPLASRWPRTVLERQRQWIGKSTGYTFHFPVAVADGTAIPRDTETLEVFTTRPDTIDEVSFIAVPLEHAGDVEGPTGALVQHPRDPQVLLPVCKADYVIADYGAGAVMGVPTADKRDRAFAERHGIVGTDAPYSEEIRPDAPAPGDRGGVESTRFRLRDWTVSRQRKWGARVPILHCGSGCGDVLVPREDLPVPVDAPITEPGLTCPSCGTSDVRRSPDTMDTFVCSSFYWLRFLDPLTTNSLARRSHSDTLLPVHTYVGGAEHATMHLMYARFVCAALADAGLVDTRTPFAELICQGMVLGETFRDATTGRYLLPAEDRSGAVVSFEKMSKSKHNGVDPVAVADELGVDTVRVFIFFKGPVDADIEWDDAGVRGVSRWFQRLISLVEETTEAEREGERGAGESKVDAESAALERERVRTVAAVTSDAFDRRALNTVVAHLMKLSNALARSTAPASSPVRRRVADSLVIMLAPLAPHLGQELWSRLGHDSLVAHAAWPRVTKAEVAAATAEGRERLLVVQVNGRLAWSGQVPGDRAMDDEEALRAFAEDQAASRLAGLEVKRVVSVPRGPGRLINFIVPKKK